MTKNEQGETTFTRCSAYGDKANLPQRFQQGDFVKIFGKVKTSIDDTGKEHTNLTVLSSKLIMTKEQVQAKAMKKQEEKKPSIMGQIKKYLKNEQAKPKENRQPGRSKAEALE